MTGSDGDRCFAGKRNSEISLHRMVARALDLGVQRDQAADGGNCGLGLAVEFVGIALIASADALVDDHRNLVVVRSMDADRAMIIKDLEAGTGGEVAIEMVVEAIGFPKQILKILVVDSHVVANLAPVKMRRLSCDQAEENDDDDQKNSCGANAGRACTFTQGRLILDQLDDAPEDQKQRPVMGKPQAQPRPGEDVQVAQQKQQAKKDQNEGTGKRAAAPSQTRGDHGVRHGPPPRRSEAEAVPEAPVARAVKSAASRDRSARCVLPTTRGSE